MVHLVRTNQLADELRQWAKDERGAWPKDTLYQTELFDLLRQLDQGLPTVEDVRGILRTEADESL